MSTPTREPERSGKLRLRAWAAKAVRILVVTVLFGWFYGWASPWCFPQKRALGFPYGMLHGALMPMALPSLVIGKNVEIYAVNNSGRMYKLGYIAGINVCGLAFFGSMFWQPSTKKHPAGPS